MSLPDIVVDYFRLLSSGDFEAAAACFAEDGFYSHPAYDPGSDGPTSGRLEAHGRQAIVRQFRLRGDRSWTHEVVSDTVGDRFYVEGIARDASGVVALSFLSIGVLSDGLIASYVAYDSRPAVGTFGSI